MNSKSYWFIIGVFILNFPVIQQAQVTSYGENDQGSALLEIQSTKKGLLIPRMTISQRDSVASPATGLIVFATTDTSFYYFNGIKWVRLEQDGGASGESFGIPDSTSIREAAGFPDSVLYKTTILNHSFSIEVQGQYAYLSRINGNNSQFDVYDISDPGNIIHKITVGDLGTFPKDIHLDGDLAALITSNELYFINITNPAAATRFPPFPYVTSTFQKTTIRFNGAYLFTLSQGNTGSPGQLEITPNSSSNPNTLGLVDIGEKPADIDFQNNYAFVVNDGNDSLEIIDYSTPATASVVHGLLLSSNPKSISISGNYAYVTDNSNQLLHVIDITNPLNASLMASINVGISPTQIRTTENYAFLLGSTGEFLIVDITNPLAPKTARTVNTGGTSSASFDIEGDYAYVSISTNGDYSIQTIPIPKETSFIPIYDYNGSVTEYSIAEKLNAAIDTFKLSGNLLQLSLSRDMESVKEVDLSSYLDNTDAQSLSLNANTISLTNGGSVDLSGFKDNTDDQKVDVFQLNGDNLELSLESDQEGTKSIDLSSFKDNTDAQTLSLSGNSLNLANGGTVNLGSFLDNTDAQTLSLSGNNLSLSGGNSVDLSAFMDTDNLGNHQATQNVQLKNQWLSNDGGSEGLRIDNNGQIGIGIPTPLAKLHLYDGNQILQRSDNANNTDILFQNSGGFYNWRISHLAGDGMDDLIIAGGNADGDPSLLTERLRIDSTGNIGIGISDPGEKLHVEGSIRMVDGNQSAGYIPVSDANGSMQWTDPATLGVGQWTVSGNDISQANSGTVGIASLTVKNAATGTNALQFHAGQDKDVWMNYKGEGNAPVGYAGNIYSYNNDDHFFVFNNSGSLRINHSDEASDSPDRSTSSNLFTLQSNGRLGVGTSSPDSKLEVAGTTTGIAGGIKITQGTHYSSIYHSASGDLILSKGGAANQLVLETDGEVGIGLNNPAARFHVKDIVNGLTNAVAVIENEANATGTNYSNGLKIIAGQNSQSVNNRFITFVRPDGTEVGAVRQTSNSGVDFWSNSDRRLKTNITPTAYGLKDLLQIEVRDYVFKDDLDNPETGFIAQQLYQKFPHAVSPGGDDPKTNPWAVNYGKLTPLLVKAVQEQQSQIELLQANNEFLKAQNKKLNDRIREIDHLASEVSRLSSLLTDLKEINYDIEVHHSKE